MRNPRSSGIRSTSRLNTSSEDGSIQCASSSRTRTGVALVGPTSSASSELIKPDARRLLARKFGGAPNLADDRVEGIVHLVRRTLIAHQEMWLVGDPFSKRCQDTRL